MTGGALRILIVDDNADDRDLAERAIRREYPGANLVQVNDAASLSAALDAGQIDAVVTDYQLKWTDGLTVLREVHARYPDVPVIMFTNTGTEEVCAEAMRTGLFDYIIKKPGNYARLPLAVRAALEHAAVRRNLADALVREQALRREAEEARRVAEAAGRMKDEFLTTLSHELRTPLNAVLGWTQMLRGGDLSADEAAHAIEVIERNARAQAQLIDDLLDMSRIASGQVRLDVRPIHPAGVVEAAVEAVLPAARAKGVAVDVAADRAAGPVMADAGRLQQIVWNLVSNAVKFTPAGGRVDVRVERADANVEIAVADTGEGIAADFLPHVFDRFRQGDQGTTRRHGGVGLGLAIVKSLAELHGGGARAKSAGRGAGATFTVWIPLAPAEYRAESPGPAAGGGAIALPDLTGVTVLVVDDEPDAVDLVSRVLRTRGAAAHGATSVRDGLDALARARPHVIVSDVGMPGEDGYALIRRVRALPRDKGGTTPAVAVTAFVRAEDRRRALLEGFQAHVSKPFDAEELIAVVASLSGRTGGRARA